MHASHKESVNLGISTKKINENVIVTLCQKFYSNFFFFLFFVIHDVYNENVPTKMFTKTKILPNMFPSFPPSNESKEKKIAEKIST